MKTENSALELHHLVKEMQTLIGAKVDKIYLDKKMILFQLHKTGVGKNLLFCQAPNYFYLISKKPAFPERPSSFCMQLRKHLDQSRVKSIEQIGFERIIKLTFSTKDKEFFFYLELFQPGNLVFTNDADKILGVASSENFADRTLRAGITYVLPPQKVNTKALSFDVFKKMISESIKESLVKTLAIDFSLGGVYAEQLCLAAGVDKNQKTVHDTEAKKLFDTLISFMDKEVVGVVYDNKEATPFKLIGREESAIFNSFSEAIDMIITPAFEFKQVKEETDAQERKTEKTEHVLKEQQNTIDKFNKEIVDNQKKGELIYLHYSELKELVEGFNTDKKKFDKKALMAKYKKIVEINEKDSIITIEI